jgi:intraflagellar transport protein 122
MSPSKRKLAVVDDNSNLSVYDLVTKELLFTEMNVSSVSWNILLDELLAYSGKGYLYIKSGNMPSNS